MIDLHSHILPVVDDRSLGWDGALQMCEAAAADGIERIVATPRCRPSEPRLQVRRNLERTVGRLQALCEEALPGKLEILLGAEYHGAREVMGKLRDEPLLTINGSRYFLLELPDDLRPGEVDQTVYGLCLAGKTPIIAHPERHGVLAKHPELLYELVQTGACAQLTAASLTGHFGAATTKVAYHLLEHGLVQMLASGAQAPDRPPVLSEATKVAAKVLGPELGRRMVVDVPQAVIEDRPVHFVEPVRPTRRALRWWQGRVRVRIQ